MIKLLRRALAFIQSVRESMQERVVALPISLNDDGEWWLDLKSIEEEPPLYIDLPPAVTDIKHLPKEVRDKLAVLIHADIGQRLNGIGKRVGRRYYLVYIKDRHYVPKD